MNINLVNIRISWNNNYSDFFYFIKNLIRRLGIRTQEEIQVEKMAVKFIRGDLNNIGKDSLNIMNVIKKE